MSEPEIASNGKDESVESLTFDVKSVADHVMTTYQISHAYLEMAGQALGFNEPEMAFAFRIAAHRTLKDFYDALIGAQSLKIRESLNEHTKDIAIGIDKQSERIQEVWKQMEDAARSDKCFLCSNPILPEQMKIHLDNKHPRCDPLCIGETGHAEQDKSDDPVEEALLVSEQRKLEGRWEQATSARKLVLV